MFLAGQLLHRGAQTHEERRAAEYIQGRFRQYTENTEIDDFHAIESVAYLFASYYGEYLVVGLFSLWWPLFAAVYGAGIFTAYMAEFMGYSIFSRFIPQFETQNVAARFLAPKPLHTFIITAHYDSGCASPLYDPGILRWLRILHVFVIAAMIVIIGACVTDALGLFIGAAYPISEYVLWTAEAYLLACATGLFFAAARTEDIRGSNVNASGVAALLRLAERFREKPLENADLWLVATGSHEAWMAGMKHLLVTQRLDKTHTYILNLEAVGAGTLHYLTGEGMLSVMPSNPKMVHAAQTVAPAFNVTPAVMRHVPSDAHIALSRGYQVMSVMGLDENRFPVNWNQTTDLVTNVEEPIIARAADFSESLLRQLEQDLKPARPALPKAMGDE